MNDDELLAAWKRGELKVIAPTAGQRILFNQALDRVLVQYGEELDVL